MGSRRRRFTSGLRPVNSIKNYVVNNQGLTPTQQDVIIADAQDSATLAVSKDVEKGCNIKAIFIDIDVCGISGTGVLNTFDGYIMKNPGSNLTPPSANTWGISNEKKFIFHTISAMIMRNQDGNAPVKFRGWIKIPKRYQRMGANDQLSFHHKCTAALAGHISTRFLYKWYK